MPRRYMMQVDTRGDTRSGDRSNGMPLPVAVRPGGVTGRVTPHGAARERSVSTGTLRREIATARRRIGAGVPGSGRGRVR